MVEKKLVLGITSKKQFSEIQVCIFPMHSQCCLTNIYFYDVLGTRIPRMGELHEFFVKLFAPFFEKALCIFHFSICKSIISFY